MVERRKTEVIAAKCQRAKERISLSNEEEEIYESDTGDETDLDRANYDGNPLQL